MKLNPSCGRGGSRPLIATGGGGAGVVANKLGVAAYYSAKVAAGCVYGTEQDGVNSLTGVTAIAVTVTAAKATIDSRCAN